MQSRGNHTPHFCHQCLDTNMMQEKDTFCWSIAEVHVLVHVCIVHRKAAASPVLIVLIVYCIGSDTIVHYLLTFLEKRMILSEIGFFSVCCVISAQTWDLLF